MGETRVIEIDVYGAEQLCPSCVHFPSSRETADWLQAAIARKYGETIKVRYIDIYDPQGEKETAFARRVIEEELWYPVVVIEDEIIAEGNPKLKKIYQVLDRLGIVSSES
ncbi:YuzD family protein [Paenactinomyces guangxiensis]|uniref:YuzD family protein n=1 Tax=Paenactinomyces guangxiensis TaxID=1490290 RepID=A0A7W1WPW0_9BACL|nr:DUF1462 family protein [Paenactinomyces guangxiensis]MBA4493739.1 YuzD family protein [Paenactinomyces guangxiensis]MBH8591027.1 YuzD family protein [Paenactinomyces guangxiensis]